MLLGYAIDGEKVIDPKDPRQVMVLEHVLEIPDDPSGSQSFSIEDSDQLRRRLQHYADHHRRQYGDGVAGLIFANRDRAQQG